MENTGGDRIEGGIGNDAEQAAIGSNISQDKSQATGNVVNVYTTPEKRRTARRSRKPSDSMAATVDERVISKLNEHDVKLAKLEMYREADQQTMLEYKRDLRQDVEEIKRELKPLFGQGILAHPQATAGKDEIDRARKQNEAVLRLLTIMAIAFVAGAVVIGIGFLWLAFSGGG